MLPQGKKAHLVGWSAGGGVAMQFTIDHRSSSPRWSSWRQCLPVPREREGQFVSEIRKMAVGDGTYPGDMQPSPHLEAPEAFRALLFSFLQQLG